MANVIADFSLDTGTSIEADFSLDTGTSDHNKLRNRDLADQHPISAISGLQEELDNKALLSNLDEEIRARISADENLQNQFDVLDNELSGLNDKINTEINNRVFGDNRLAGLISTEETRAKTAEQGLSDDINSEAGTRTSEITRVEGLITAEETARINADNALQGNINAEKTARENADSTLQANINAEALARQNADGTLQSNIDAEVVARGNADTALNTKIDNHIADKANPHQVTKTQVGLGNVDNTADIDKPISTAVSAAFDAVEDEINEINSKIPNAASSSNQLADKAFVNSSIATNTATFIGTFNSVAELEAYSGTLTNNDYAFVVVSDAAGNTAYDRYKYTDATTPAGWVFEYELNNSSFTAAQWNAINSGATSALIGQITTNQGNITTIQTTMSGYGNIVTHNVSEFATAAQGTKADTAVQPADLATVATSGSYNDLNDKPTIGNATLTIQKNGTAVDTFTANATADKAINLIVPTDTGDLTNGAGYITGITSSDVTTALGYTPYNSSNPSGYQTASDVQTAIAGKQDTLVSGTNIKTINNTSILGSGDVTLTASSVGALPSSTKYGADLSYSSNTLQLKDQDGNNLGNSVTIQSSPDLDETTINKNSSNELQTIGVINQNDTTTAIKTWTGTKTQYEAIVTKNASTEYFCTDSGELYLGDVKIGSGAGGLNPFSLLDYKYSEYALSNASWLLSNGQFNSGSVYQSVYDLLLQIYNGTTTKAGVSVKLSTEAYADTDFVVNTSNTTFRLPLYTQRVLVEKKEPTDSDQTWYNLYSDGWCEQGGLYDNNSAVSSYTGTITLLKPFKDTNYTAFCTMYSGNSQTNVNLAAITKVSMKIVASPNYGNSYTQRYAYWQASGYCNPPSVSEYTEIKGLYFYVGEVVQDANIIAAAGVLTDIADLKNASNFSQTGLSTLSGLGMPSNRTRIDLTFGATGTTYVAPANGYFACHFRYSSTAGWGGAFLLKPGGSALGVGDDILGTQMLRGTASNFAYFLPAQKGQVLYLNYSGMTSDYFGFIYAQGEN